MHLHQVRHGPQAGKGEEGAAGAGVDQNRRPGSAVAHDREQAVEQYRAVEFRRRRGAAVRLIGPVADDQPAQRSQHQRNDANADEHAAPAGGLRQSGQRRTGQHRTEVADQHADADQRREAVFLEPDGNQLEHGNEGHRHPQPDQRAADQDHVERGRHAEQETADAADDATKHENAPRPEGVGQHAGRHLHDGVDIEIGRGQHPQRRRRGLEGCREILRDAGRGKALEEGQDVGQRDNAKGKPTSAHLRRVQVVHVLSPGIFVVFSG